MLYNIWIGLVISHVTRVEIAIKLAENAYS